MIKIFYEINPTPSNMFKRNNEIIPCHCILGDHMGNQTPGSTVTDVEAIAPTYSVQAEWDQEDLLPSGDCRECQLLP